MALKSKPRNLSFDVLRDENEVFIDPLGQLIGKKKKKRKKKKKKKGSVGKLMGIGGSGVVNLGRYSVVGSSMVTVAEEGCGGIGDLGCFDVGGRGRIGNLGGFEGKEWDKMVNLGGFEVEGRGKIGNSGGLEVGEKGKMVNSGGFDSGGRGKMVNLDGFEVDGRGEMVNLDDVEVEGKGRTKSLKGFEVEGRGKIGNLGGADVDGFEEGRGDCGVEKFGGELRQRNVGLSGGSEEVSSSGTGLVVEENGKEESNSSRGSSKRSESMTRRKLAKELSLDWNNVMANDHRLLETGLTEISPIKHFMEDLHTGHSLNTTVTIGNEKDRESVYDTIFHLPWRCELLIDVGFFVCFDSFLSVLTIMPVRMAMTLWKFLKRRQFLKPSADELSDFGCLLVLASGVSILQQTDISLIYHMIRGQGTVKLYVVYNVLEIFDKLCQSFVGEVMQTMFQSANELANCSPENMRNALLRFVSDEVLAIVSSLIHSFILLVQAITLSTCIVSHNNALFALLLSNNFSEIKSNVFKRFSKDNVHSIAYSDSVERFHICAFLMFVLAQNLLEAEGPWFSNFVSDALQVYVCEVFIDIIKHSFIAKFNDIKPIAFSEFLEDLSKQTLNKLTEPEKRRLVFVPLAPACAVLRVLRPVYDAHLPYNPLPWRLLCMFLLFALTFVMLGALKIMVSKGLKQYASWYVKRCENKKSHKD